MKTWIIVGIVALLVIGVPVVSFIAYGNYGNAQERGIEAQYDKTKNVASRMSTSVFEVVQVPEIAKNDIIEIITKATEARYGEEGIKSVVAAIQESNPQIDGALYTRIQDIINSGRTDFANEQSILIDRKRAYETALGNFWSGLWLRASGYPRIDLDDFDPVTDERTEQIFDSGVDRPMQLGT